MRAVTVEETAPRASDRGPARRLGGYELRAKIADGGMAEVHVGRRVTGPGEGEVVAIKTIREQFARNKEFVTMFMDEARIVARLRHPNIIRQLELGAEEGELFLAMELLFGQSLWSLWDACRARSVRLRYDTIAWIGARVAEGLHYAHELVDEQGRPLDIVHRDVNATNIFVTYDGEIKVIDFGLAKAANRASKTAAGVIKGKVAYMSPEQAVGAPVDRRTDIFALGTTLWELACDRRLFKRSDDVETLRRVHAAEVPDATRLVDGFPPDLWRILERALARDKEQRYRTAADMARDLDALARVAGQADAGAPAVAKVMRELFAEDHARQVSWVAEASGPTPPGRLGEPLKPPSTFWEPQQVAAIPPARPLAASSPNTGVESREFPPFPARLGKLHYAAIALALSVVAAILLFVLRD
jgi:eukaryotic-like serine/threonine-protein kinase